MLAGQRSCAGRTAQAPAPCRARTHKSASLSGRPRPRPRPRPSPTRACALQRGCVAAPKAAAPRNVPIPLIPARSVAAWGITAGTILGLYCAHIDPHSCAAARRRCRYSRLRNCRVQRSSRSLRTTTACRCGAAPPVLALALAAVRRVLRVRMPVCPCPLPRFPVRTLERGSHWCDRRRNFALVHPHGWLLHIASRVAARPLCAIPFHGNGQQLTVSAQWPLLPWMADG